VGVVVGVGLADGLDVGLPDAVELGVALEDEEAFRDDPGDGLPAEGECPADAGAPPALPATGALPWLPPDFTEPVAAELPGVDPPPPTVPGGEAFVACVVCVWE
jgi:hypothetical protein